MVAPIYEQYSGVVSPQGRLRWQSSALSHEAQPPRHYIRLIEGVIPCIHKQGLNSIFFITAKIHREDLSLSHA